MDRYLISAAAHLCLFRPTTYILYMLCTQLYLEHCPLLNLEMDTMPPLKLSVGINRNPNTVSHLSSMNWQPSLTSPPLHAAAGVGTLLPSLQQPLLLDLRPI